MQLKNFLAAAICTADTRLRRGVLLLLSIIVLPLSVASCAWLDGGDPIFEYPHDGGEDPTLVTVNLTYHCCGEMPVYQKVHLTKSGESAAKRRYFYEILSASGTAVERGTLERRPDDVSDINLTFTLAPGEYRAVMWQDCTDETGKPFYDATSLNAVLIRDVSSYAGSTDLKDASWNITDISIPKTGEWNICVDYDINLERPVAKISFISTDGPVFLQRCAEYLRTKSQDVSTEVLERIKLVISYEGYLLNRFNAEQGEFRNSSMGYSFTGKFVETDKSTDLLLGSDYVFVNGEEGIYWMRLTVIDTLDGSVITQTEKICVPVKRGHETTVSGDILTKDWGRSVSIDPEFTGEFDYYIN